MTITPVAAGTAAANAGATTITPTRPAGLASGDVRLALVEAGGAGSTTPDTVTGWDLIATVARTSTHRISCYLRVCGASEADAAFPQTVSGFIYANEYAFRGVDPTNPLDVSPVTSSGPRSASYSAPGITPISPDAMVVWMFGKPDDNSIGTPSQGTQGYSVSTTTGTDGNLALVYELQGSPADSGSCQMTEGANGTDNWTSITIALRPAVTPAADPSLDIGDDVAISVEIAPGGAPYTPNQAWVDVAGDDEGLSRDAAIVITRGRQSEFSEIGPGQCSGTFLNGERTYDPDYAAGPYYPNLTPMTPVRVRARYTGGGGGGGGGDTVLGESILTDAVCYWPMTEATAVTAADATGNGYNLTYPAATSVRDSFVPGLGSQDAKRFTVTGTTDYTASVAQSAYNLIRAVELWVSVDDLDPTASVSSLQVIGIGLAGGVGIDIVEDTITEDRYVDVFAYTDLGSFPGEITTATLPDTTDPLHIVAVISNDNTTFTLYINGAVYDTQDISGGNFTTADGDTGRFMLQLSDAQNTSLAHVAFYTDAPTGAEVLARYEAGVSGDGTGVNYALYTGLIQSWPQTYYGNQFSTVSWSALDVMTLIATKRVPTTLLDVRVLGDAAVAYWPMNEDPAVTAIDATGSGYDAGYPFGYTTPTDSFLPGESGQKAQTFTLSGGSVDIAATHDGAFDDILTVEGWMSVASLANDGLSSVDITGVGRSTFLQVVFDVDSGTSQRSLRFIVVDSALSTIVDVRYGGVPNIPQVFHVAATLDLATDTLTGYVNGQAVVTASTSAGDFGGTSLTGSFGVGVNGTITASVAHVAFYEDTLSAADILDHYAAGMSGGYNDTAATRMADLAEFVGLTDAGLYEWVGQQNDTYLAAAAFNGDALAEMQMIARSEQGRLFVGADGVVTMQARTYDMDELTVNGASQMTFVEMTDPDDTGYSLLEFEPASRDLIKNRADVSMVGGTITVIDRDSAAQVGESPASVATVLRNPADARSLGLSILRRYADPASRITAIVIEPRINPDVLFPFVLQVDLGWRITVQRTPQGIGSPIEDEYTVEGLRHEIRPRDDWKTTLYLVPAVNSYTQEPWFRLGDTSYGRLGADIDDPGPPPIYTVTIPY